MAYYRPRRGQRDGTPYITVPRTITQMTYFNIPLAEMLKERGIAKVHLMIDKQDKIIRIREAGDRDKGYSILRTGTRGWGITPKLRKELPAGRYELRSTPRSRILEFART